MFKNIIRILKKKSVWIPALIILLIIGWRVNAAKNKKNYTVSGTVNQQDVRQSVLATGTVTSQSDLNLSFKGSGVVTKVNASVGDKVRKGQMLAALDQRDAVAAINQASASVLAAKANYDKLANGASTPEVQVAQAAVTAAQVTFDNAKNVLKNTFDQQSTAVSNAYSAMLNSGLSAITGAGNSSTATAILSGTYTGKEQGSYTITVQSTSSGLTANSTGLETSGSYVSRGTPSAIGTRGLFITFSVSGNLNIGDSWTVSVPNAQSSSYLTSYNAYQTALQTQTQTITQAQGAVDAAQAALDQAKASLSLKQSTARPEDLASATAQIQTAQAQLLMAQNQYANNQIVAPIDGIVTSINLKLGETVPPQKVVITMLDQLDLHVESNISESSISLVKLGQSIDMTLDAFGPDKHFSGEIISIDPAATVSSGVINYRVVSSIPKEDGIKPGMTVNLVILIAEKKNVLAVPNRLIRSVNSKKFVTILKDNKTADIEITTGLSGDQFTEVLSGLSGGETLVTLSAVN